MKTKQIPSVRRIDQNRTGRTLIQTHNQENTGSLALKRHFIERSPAQLRSGDTLHHFQQTSPTMSGSLTTRTQRASVARFNTIIPRMGQKKTWKTPNLL